MSKLPSEIMGLLKDLPKMLSSHGKEEPSDMEDMTDDERARAQVAIIIISKKPRSSDDKKDDEEDYG